MMMMMIGLKTGPRARTVKTGPRHLRNRPDPGQNRLGPHKAIPLGEARQCTPAGTEAVISLSSHSPTANQYGNTVIPLYNVMSITRYIMSAPYKAVANYTHNKHATLVLTHTLSLSPTLSLCCCSGPGSQLLHANA